MRERRTEERGEMLRQKGKRREGLSSAIKLRFEEFSPCKDQVSTSKKRCGRKVETKRVE